MIIALHNSAALWHRLWIGYVPDHPHPSPLLPWRCAHLPRYLEIVAQAPPKDSTCANRILPRSLYAYVTCSNNSIFLLGFHAFFIARLTMRIILNLWKYTQLLLSYFQNKWFPVINIQCSKTKPMLNNKFAIHDIRSTNTNSISTQLKHIQN